MALTWAKLCVDEIRVASPGIVETLETTVHKPSNPNKWLINHQSQRTADKLYQSTGAFRGARLVDSAELHFAPKPNGVWFDSLTGRKRGNSNSRDNFISWRSRRQISRVPRAQNPGRCRLRANPSHKWVRISALSLLCMLLGLRPF